MEKTLRVLIVEDSEDAAELLTLELKRGGYHSITQRVETDDDLAASLSKEWDIVLLDYNMPRLNVMTALNRLKQLPYDLPVIIVSAAIGEERAAELMKLGANDYIRKGNLARLVPSIDRELREVEDRRQRKAAENSLNYLAYHDPLTSLANHNAFHLHCAKEISQAGGKAMVMLIININNIRDINNTLGYKNGDLVVKHIGKLVENVLPDNALLARLRGNDFGLLLKGGADTAALLAQKILTSVQQPFVLETLSVDIEIVIGMAQFPEDGNDVGTLLGKANIALQSSIRSGTEYAFYASSQDTVSREHIALLGELRAAIGKNELMLMYQPKIEVRTGHVIGMEALVRWRHPQQGLLPPGQFIPLVERTGLINLVAQWTLWEAILQCQAWQKAGYKIPIAVNLSTRNLQDINLPEQIRGFLETAETPPHLLELEITESVLMADPSRALPLLKRLHEMGINISIDDFGTGYSSMAYLKQLPINEIKIDKTFITSLMRNHGDAVITRSTIDLGRNMGLFVTAEGVEDQHALDGLMVLGCDRAQGYHISRPAPPNDILQWLQNRDRELPGEMIIPSR